jgi:hypothetical protein
MTEEDILELLESGEYSKVSRALIFIEKKLEERPSRRLISKLVELCSDSDPDVRQEAVQAAGFYWQLPEAFSVIAAILDRTDEDDLVLIAAVYAICEMASNKVEMRNRGLCILAQVALNESMPIPVRKEAYALALKLSGRISIDDFAKMAVSAEVVIDKELMTSFCDNLDLM